MHQATKTVFDAYLHNPTTTYTSIAHSGFLASAESIALQVTFGRSASAIDEVTFTLSIEHSSDGEGFSPKRATPELVLSKSHLSLVWYGEPVGAVPNLPFCRLRLDLSGAVPIVKVTVLATVRSRRARHPEKRRRPLMGPVTHETLHEIRKHAARAHNADDPMAHIAAHLTPAARKEVEAFAKQFRELPPASRAHLASSARLLHKLASAAPVTTAVVRRAPKPAAAPCTDCSGKKR